MSFAKEFYYNGEPYLPTLQRIHHALKQSGALVELVGEAGAGKSSICDKLQQYLKRKQFRVITFRQPPESVEILHSLLARELDVAALEHSDAILSEALRSLQQPLVLIFDDAQQLSDVIMLELMRLADVEEHGLGVLLARQSSLSQSLQGQRSLPELEERITDWFHLQAMNAQQFHLFLRAYFDENGLFAVQVEPEAEAQLYRKCRGLPGPAVKLVGHLLGWCLANPAQELISRRQIDQIFQNHEGWQQSANLLASGDRQRNGLLPVAVVVVIASLAFLYQQLAEQDVEPVVSQASPFLASEPVAETESADSIGEAATDVVVAGAAQNSDAEAVAEPAEDAVLTAQQQALARELARQRELQELAQEQLSDSGLALVTAQERGIPAEQFALPEYEELLELAGQDSQSGSNNAASAETVAVAVETSVETVEETAEEAIKEAARVAEAREENADQVTEQAQQRLAANLNEAVEETPAAETAAASEAEPEATVESTLASTSAGLESEPEAATPTESVPVSESPADSADDSVPADLLRTVVLSWLQAWESQSLPAYFAHYHDNFEPRYQDDQLAWRRNRERIIGNAEFIQLQMSDFAVIESSQQQAEVHFWLRYQSGSYQDETLKKLVLVQAESNWLIVEEVNLEVRVGMAPTAPAPGTGTALAAF